MRAAFSRVLKHLSFTVHTPSFQLQGFSVYQTTSLPALINHAINRTDDVTCILIDWLTLESEQL